MKNKKILSFLLLMMLCVFMLPIPSNAKTINHTVKVGNWTREIGPTYGSGYDNACYKIISGDKYIKIKKINTKEGKFFKAYGKKKGTGKVKCTYGKKKENIYVFTVK